MASSTPVRHFLPKISAEFRPAVRKVQLSASKSIPRIGFRRSSGGAVGSGRKLGVSISSSKDSVTREEDTRKAAEARIGFNIETLRSDGYKFKKLERLCKLNGVRSKGTTDQLKKRLEHFYEISPGIYRPNMCFKFDNWVVYNAHARRISGALADCSSVLEELEGMLSEEEYNELLKFEQSFDEPSLGLDEQFSAADQLYI
eukprot:CAMPEP_0198205252 /NCGR_PEP_ID=MMETSP1445-20131203/8760_1 /TAXON_ID=36898 /ORGANISM="Pyramimonas sp., Strain CCMP2087" /LENGTH=200 /DNA_ID=CAMNT_0043877481 /DNA_START=29 /DNA_END=631 /DNA_ORIENTATION=-